MELTLEVERAIDLCYDAVLAPELWAYALDRLAWGLYGAPVRAEATT